ncbi:MAG TPA: DUF6775 family putative metallopeptidase, partial [Thermodesulfobacteriota bacterium]|nr:DUF6775 family putative metallopeptidase [Thermodesulfobacteriota bacterium]
MRLYIIIMSRIKEIFIYSDCPSNSLSVPEVIDYLRETGFSAEYRGNFFEFLDLAKEEAQELTRKIAGTRVLDISTPLDEVREPIYGEIGVELRRLKGEASTLGVLYDGLWLQRIFYKIIYEKIKGELGSGFIHIIFTGRLFGTFETGDSLKTLPPFDPAQDKLDSYPRSPRYHARVILTGLPSLISTSGIVEAPARPKDYYWLKAGFIRAGKDVREL